MYWHIYIYAHIYIYMYIIILPHEISCHPPTAHTHKHASPSLTSYRALPLISACHAFYRGPHYPSTTPAIWVGSCAVRLCFADDKTYCAAKFIGVLHRSFDWICWEPPEEGRDVEFPRQLAILTDCTSIIWSDDSWEIFARLIWYKSYCFSTPVLIQPCSSRGQKWRGNISFEKILVFQFWRVWSHAFRSSDRGKRYFWVQNCIFWVVREFFHDSILSVKAS